MKNSAQTSVMRSLVVCLAFAVLFSSSTIVLAASGTKSMAAEIVVSGYNGGGENSSVLLNGEPVSSGRTFYTSGSISTAQASATINLGKLGRVSIQPGSKLDLTFSENSISGNLSAGSIEVLNNAGVAVNINTPDNMVTNDSTKANSIAVDVTSGTTRASALNGSAFTKDGAAAADDANNKKKKGGAFWLPVIFAAAVATAVIIVVTTSGDDDLNVVSPVR
jgi:hypothetical protein